MYFCGIDVAKRQHMASVLTADGAVAQAPFAVTNPRAGFDHLRQALAGLGGPVTLGLEATGHSWLARYDDLTRHGYAVVVFNPLQVHAFRQSGVRQVKTDRSDAVWIAEYLRFGNHRPHDPLLSVRAQLKELSRFRYHLTDPIGDAQRQRLSVPDRVFPEYDTACSSVFVAASRRLLAQAASAHESAEFDLDELTALLRTASRGRFGPTQAQARQALARQSVGVSFLADAAQVEVRCRLAQIDLLEAQRARVDDAIEALLAQGPQHLLTIPGVGAVTGAAMLAEIGDVQRFETVEQRVAYAGIDASVYPTGEFEGSRQHMSKRGSPYLRQAAPMAIWHNPELKAYSKRKRQEGKHPGTALGAVCRKLLARVYVVLKEQRPYRESPPRAVH